MLDLVAVVRCNCCKYSSLHENDSSRLECNHDQWGDSSGWAANVKPNDFCSHGQLKDELN